MPGGGLNCTFYLLVGSSENEEENGGTRGLRGEPLQSMLARWPSE